MTASAASSAGRIIGLLLSAENKLWFIYEFCEHITNG